MPASRRFRGTSTIAAATPGHAEALVLRCLGGESRAARVVLKPAMNH